MTVEWSFGFLSKIKLWISVASVILTSLTWYKSIQGKSDKIEPNSTKFRNT